MYGSFPNIELDVYKFKSKLLELGIDFRRNEEVDVKVFSQMWGSTATGFGDLGYCGGSAITKEYTVVCNLERENIFCVMFGNTIGYIIKNPKGCFLKDLADCNTEGAGKHYGYVSEQADILYVAGME